MLNIYKLLHFKEVIMLQIPIYCQRPCFRRYQLSWLEEKYTEEFLHSLNSKDFFLDLYEVYGFWILENVSSLENGYLINNNDFSV
jgi:hypothetical protein